MEKINLNAKIRDISGRKVKKLRAEGLIPVIMYGHDVEPKMMTVDKKEFNHIYQEAGGSTMVELNIENNKEPVNILIHQVDFHPQTDEIVHTDFIQVKLTEKIKAEIPIILIGDDVAPVVKEKEGSIVISKQQIEVEAFPQDLIHEITLDVSYLTDFEQSIHVKDLDISNKITILDDLEDIIVYIQEPRSEEELAELEEEVKEDIESVEVEEKGKEDDENEEVDGAEKKDDVVSQDKKDENQK